MLDLRMCVCGDTCLLLHNLHWSWYTSVYVHQRSKRVNTPRLAFGAIGENSLTLCEPEKPPDNYT